MKYIIIEILLTKNVIILKLEELKLLESILKQDEK